MQLWGPPPGGVTVTLTWDLRGCGFQGQSSLISPMQLDSVLEVEHRGSTHLRTPDTCGAKGTPNRKEAAQTKQAEVEPGGPGSTRLRCQGQGQAQYLLQKLLPGSCWHYNGAQGS